MRFFILQGKILNNNIGAGVILSNQSLVLQGVSRSTAGNYTCVGYNTEGDGESTPFYLNVMCEYYYTLSYGLIEIILETISIPSQQRSHLLHKNGINCLAHPPFVQVWWTRRESSSQHFDEFFQRNEIFFCLFSTSKWLLFHIRV